MADNGDSMSLVSEASEEPERDSEPLASAGFFLQDQVPPPAQYFISSLSQQGEAYCLAEKADSMYR
jgi:hypothetical protein